MMVLVPAVGMPHEELLQDTLKSIGVGCFTLAAAFAFFWKRRKSGFTLKLHPVLLLPLALLLYALGCMGWSHTYLAGVEAVRWFVFGLLVLLGLNSLNARGTTTLAWCIHLGAVLAALWAALQFWFDWSFFVQGPNPASTFLNRNFFAEYLVCTLPFSALLLSRVHDKSSVFLLTFSLAFNVVALFMTGTRSALLGLMGVLGLLLILIYWYRHEWVSHGWTRWHVVALLGVFLLTLLTLGSLPCQNTALLKDAGDQTALQRAYGRTLSVLREQEYSTGSFSVRAQMWQATARMIAAHPLSGVGAGAWEVHIGLYQGERAQVESDYYAHNEPLQLMAEYGVVGWIFLLLLLGYLGHVGRQLWRERGLTAPPQALARGCAWVSLLVLLWVSNAGFPWRMASTGALFALSLGLLATRRPCWRVRVSPPQVVAALCLSAVCSGIAASITLQAIECETKLVRAAKMALSISASGRPNAPIWLQDKREMLQLVEQGVRINPHYRKLTPIVADALASWGDWANATWIWDSVLASRPYVVVLLANAGRGHLLAGNWVTAQSYLERAEKIQPQAAALTALRAMLQRRQTEPIATEPVANPSLRQ